jgi:hypothetical protein
LFTFVLAQTARTLNRQTSNLTQNTVELHSFETRIGFATYSPDIRTILPLLTKSFTEAAKTQTEQRPVNKELREQSENQRDKAQKVPELTEGSGKGGLGGSITHQWFWPRMGKVRCRNRWGLIENGEK